MRSWYSGIACGWFDGLGDSMYALPSADKYGTYAAFGLARVSDSGGTRTLVSQSPMVTYSRPKDAVVQTVHGLWPAPVEVIGALARDEVTGESKAQLVYMAYWHALSYSPALRKWVAEQHPKYWTTLVRSFPALSSDTV
jgi:hypothetical protein